jgi:purine-binding chemotaxis protein CheW
MMDDRAGDNALLCRIGSRLYAIALAHVVEVMRPLPIEIMAGAFTFVRGLSVIRGVPTPVVDLAILSDGNPSQPDRFISIRTGSRQIALMADSVFGIRSIPMTALRDLPPLLQGLQTDLVSAIGTLDEKLLLVLNDTRLVPEGFWATMETGEIPA